MTEPEVEDEPLSARWALVIAIGLLLVLRELVPFGRQALYPFTLFATWVHEMGHGITGLATGGTFEELSIFWNASGFAAGAVEPGWREALRSAGGLLGPPLIGAVVLATARGPRRASIVLFVLATAVLVSVPIWVRSLTGWLVLPPTALALGAVAWKGGPTTRHVFAQGLGVVLALDTVTRIDYLFSSSATVDGRELPSDVSRIAETLGGHYLLWGALLAVVSFALLAAGLKLAWAEPLKLRWPSRPKSATAPERGASATTRRRR